MSKGIRISDGEEILNVNLPDILKEIAFGNSYHWSILNLEGMGDLGNIPVPVFEKEINDSSKGLIISWNDLNQLALKYRQIVDMTLIGCKDVTALKRYENDQEMYKACDIVIVMFDSSYWEVFTKDDLLMDCLANKFNEITWLTYDSV